MSTAIQWTDETWNPVTGCSRVSEGCRHCYIERTPPFRMGGRKLGDPVQLHPERLDQPLRWTKPRRVFVNSLSDLFHEDVPDEFIDRIFAVMTLAHNHTFQILTKRPERLRQYCTRLSDRYVDASLAITRTAWWDDHARSSPCAVGYIEEAIEKGPLPNVWLGVSVEDQKTADERITILLQTPAAVRWISAEPLLGPVDLDEWVKNVVFCNKCGYFSRAPIGSTKHDGCNYMAATTRRIDWVVAGGESGPGARPCDVVWIRSIVEQCKAAAVPVFVKQLGSNSNHRVPGEVHAAMTAAPIECKHGYDVCPTCDRRSDKMWDKKGGDPAEWPEDLRVRECPR